MSAKFKRGTPDYERLINIVHDAALAAGKRLCGPFAWRDRPDFTCFQNASEIVAVRRGVADELGPLKDIDTSRTLLGHFMEHPILLAPTSSHLLAHPAAEIATAPRGRGR